MNSQSGIYQITNVANGKIYVGSTIDMSMRFYSHKQCLRKGSHCNTHLQRAWDMYGEGSFVFNVLLLCEKDELLRYEQGYLDILQPDYNIAICAIAPGRGLRRSEETRAKMSEANKGRKHSDETRAKIGAASKNRIPNAETRAKMSASRTGEKNPMYGKHLSEESIAKRKASLVGYVVSEETRAKMRAANTGNHKALGYKHTEEARAKMSAARKGVPFTEEHKHNKSIAQIGRVVTEETRAKISATKLRRHNGT